MVEVFRGQDGAVEGFCARGHTGFAARGHDIVCAGASAVLQAAVLGVTRHLGLPAEVQAGDGYLEMRLGPAVTEREAWERAQAVLETAVLGIEEIARRYGRHVKVVQRHGGERHGSRRTDAGDGSDGSAALRAQEGSGQLPQRP
ncbi:MAG TPA: ribosomal-processing cysteine protease Prp [Limnochordales bacterium]